MDSPDQGAFGLATTQTKFSDNKLEIMLENMGIQYSGVLEGNHLKGTFTQGGTVFELNLSRNEISKEVQKTRPQDPIKPYGYQSENVYFTNDKANNIKLAGTLTLPKNIKNPPVVIMISGSGPQNRDEEIAVFNHRPFLVWSDYLTKNGIAVLRYDDRGVAESEGSQENATSADFATDVEAAVNYLKTRKDIDRDKIGLIGHSEGGFIAPMVAFSKKENKVNKDIAFIVLLAGTGVDGGEVLTSQARRAAELAGATTEELDFNEILSNKIFDIVKIETDSEKLKTKLANLLHETKTNGPAALTKDITNESIKAQIKILSSKWFGYFIRTNPNDFLSEVSCPVLAINGEKDFQVLADLNLNGIKDSLKKANNNDVTIKKMPSLNHLLQTAQTGAADEYKKIEETVSPKALKLVADWINIRFGVTGQ